ncbi:hypothetical protein PHMEG_00033571 [Phytophthora megakarya]|uniref:Uncharacterized protein n=1 Tax=Phytophthora megakarya TaxID=4795 RepID=A0A225USS9_9STRA|nr:hypothetical protein PHMEG_00033571 [Phytophthora megakarya]
MEKQQDSIHATSSDNKTISFSCKAGGVLPTATRPECRTMLDLAQAVTGVCNFAATFLFEHAQQLASAL